MNTIRRVVPTVLLTSTALVVPATQAVATPAATSKSFVMAQGTVTSSTLNVRTAPSTRSALVSTYRRGAVLTPVCSRAGQAVAGSRTWYWTEGVSSGWVSATYVKVTQGHVPACSAYPDTKLLNVRITRTSQINAQLAGTPASFRTFIAKVLRQNQQWDGQTSGCHTTISIDAWWNSNQAIGDVTGCIGYAALWTYSKGAWHELGTQAAVPCTEMREAGATHAINGNLGWACTVPSKVRGQQPVVVQYNPRG